MRIGFFHRLRNMLRRATGLRSQSGQQLVEIALLTPVMLLLLVGLIELGRFAFLSIVVANAARAGAAFGSQGLVQSVDTADIEASSDNDFQNNGQNVSKLTVSSSTSCGCDSAGTVTSQSCNGNGAGTCGTGHWVVMVSVTASGTFNSLFGYPGLPKSISVSRTSTMRVQQ